ncbi:hypothetical protein OHA72_35160 [Dactylosporangium sp. NBC_01737]|uniref:hypothetical protein n=1 Tax=Dactylosporangium sp. NBC_01737 TaxID=2975959 RepID=UPI002E1409F6|nr:hypothetical protein OHA72_35160 [Dactylosporangium sp. NBC_01737]
MSVPGRRVKAVPPLRATPGPREVEDRARLADELRTALERTRRNAENWRTGMAGLLTLVTATLLFKGRASIADYAPWAGYALGALVLAALAAGLVSLWLFLAAAYGRLAPTSAQRILDGGGIEPHTVRLATVALADLRLARRLAVLSAGLLAVALLLSWYGPAAETTAPLVQVTAREAPPVCGTLDGMDAQTVLVRVAGEPSARRISATEVLSLRVVQRC